MIVSLDSASASALVAPRGQSTATQAVVGPVNVAMIHLVPTPYFQQLHRSLRQGLPGVNLSSLYIHSKADQPWELNDQNDVQPVALGAGSPSASRLGKITQALATARRVIRWLREHQIRCVVLCGYSDIIRLHVIAWCKLNQIPCYIMGDSNIRNDNAQTTGLKAFIKKSLLSAIIKSSSGVMPFGSVGVEYFRKYGAIDHKIFPTPPGPDYAMIRAVTPDDVAKVRDRFKLAPDRKRLIYTGRLTAIKRVDLVIDAFAKIAHDRPDWDLLLVGDGEERQKIQARIPAHLKSRVVFTGFVNDPHTLASLYRTANALVLASRYEAWGLVVNEALASGLAAVASDVVGAAADLIVEGYNGRTFKNEDLDSLINALREVTHDANTSRMQAASGAVLAAYRSRFDPVEGFRGALRLAGLWPITLNLGKNRSIASQFDDLFLDHDELTRQVA